MAQDPAATIEPEDDPASRSDAFAFSSEGYELGEEIGRGGMGVVYRARDVALGREVAIKVLGERFPADSPVAQRFVSEARITGQLQHPGIPPVHQVGTLDGKRPYLAMKLIKGRTLEAILKDRSDPASERGRLLGVFESVCQAVGYAHAHRVIHRDIKPANIMVGAFGEVQVMDWGLAKVLGQAGESSAEPTSSQETQAWTQVGATPEGGSHTQAGSLVGTPAFIPPEQAVGQIDQVDARSDVFGLGALLAMILTGKPPYVGDTFEAVRIQAVRGQLDDCLGRLDACGAEPELVELCRSCLAFEPANRPRDGGELAQAVAGLRAAADERAAAAEKERLAAEVRIAEQAKRRRVLLRAAVLVGTILVLGVAGTTLGLFQAEGQRRIAVQAQREETAQREIAMKERQEALEARTRAQAEARRASRAAATADQVAEFLVGLFEPGDRIAVGPTSLEFRKAGDGPRARELLARGVARLQAADLSDQPLVRARLLHEIGVISLGLGDTEGGGALLSEALELRRAHLPADHPALARTMAVVAVARFVQGERTCIDLYRDAIAILKKQPESETLELAEVETNLAIGLLMFNYPDNHRQAIELYRHALEIRRARLGEQDMQTVTTLWLLAYLHLDGQEYLKGLGLIAELQRSIEKSSANPDLKEAVRRAAKAIRSELFRFSAEATIAAWRDVTEQVGKVFGEHHYISLKAKRKFAGVIYFAVANDDARLEEAAKLFAYGAEVGPVWDRTLNRFDLGRTLMRLGRDAEAEAALSEALQGFRRENARLSWEKWEKGAHALDLLARLKDRSSDPRNRAMVESLLEQAVEAAGKEGVRPGRLGLAYRDLARYRLIRKADVASTPALFAEAAVLFEKQSRDTEHRLRVAEALAYQSIALGRQGKTAEAEKLRSEAERIAQRFPGERTFLAGEVRLLLQGKLPPWQ